WTARIVALRAELAELQAFVSALHSSPDLRAFIDKRTRRLPAFFALRSRQRLGRLGRLLTHDDLLPATLRPGQSLEMLDV
ncbi:MAG: hypothetical protein KDK91_18665, partial [Gammaproteobacteria bacterium]|nr:hypothetical protein [Gammaproteobacteria bacterium]